MSQQHRPPDLPPSYSPSSSVAADARDASVSSFVFPSVKAGGISPSHSHHPQPIEPSLDSSPALRHPLDLARLEASAARTLPPIPSPLSTNISRHTRSPSSTTSHALSTSAAMSLGGDAPPRATSASLDDANDRMAAEALCGLGKLDSQSPKYNTSTPTSTSRLPVGYDTPLQYYPIGIEHTRPGAATDEPEPLLSLLTTSHPWLGGTINSSINAYSSTKSYTPRFIQYGAGLVENTVGSVGRRTGVEGSIRRYLGARRPSTDNESMNPNVLRHDERGNLDMIAEQQSRYGAVDHKDLGMSNGVPAHRTSSIRSVETLPPYDENVSPPYEEAVDDETVYKRYRPSVQRSWSRQLMISTSGLGVALSDSSLRSLKHTLKILARANNHVRQLMEMLKKLMGEYHSQTPHAAEEGRATADTDAMAVDPSDPGHAIAASIHKLNDEIWHTFKGVVTVISRYTGGTLPENASAVVRWQLMSVPRRWQRAVSQSTPPSVDTLNDSPPSSNDDAVASGNRMLAFAIEGLDMMDQVGGVVDSTIVSAERWLDTMGRRKKNLSTDTTTDEPAPAEPAADKAAAADGEDRMEGVEQAS